MTLFMKPKPHIPILLAVAALTSCNTNYRPQTVRTTITRPVIAHGYSSTHGTMMTASGVETVTTEQPYQSPAYQAAGEALFSR